MPWYHASTQRLEVGTVLRPRGGPSRWESNLYVRDSDDAVRRQEWVWVDVDPTIWSGADAPFVYEVEPHEKPRLWYPDEPEEGWITSAATVTMVLSLDGGGTWLDD